MLDFVSIRTSTRLPKKNGEEGLITIFPEFVVGPSDDLMVRGGAFYAVWDETTNYWSKDAGTVCKLVDAALTEKASRYPEGTNLDIRYLREFSSKKWSEFLAYVASLPDSYEELDSKVTFLGDAVNKKDYVSKCLPYSLQPGDISAYDELVGTLYEPIERQKIEWAIGSVFAGDSKRIQKFLVLYGTAGSGKSTMLNIIQMLFDGYYNVFEAKALTSSSNNFSLEMFRNNPLVSIQHDGDLSRIEDNTKLNSIVSHEEMVVNEKRKAQYVSYFRTFLFMGTNKPVKITDAKSGIVRRLIDVRPSGETIPFDRYQILMAQIKFELGAIAVHCLKVYNKLGIDAYNAYRPIEMLGATNDFYNFVEDHYEIFVRDEGVSLSQVWVLYKKWCDDSAVRYPMNKRAIKEELKSYFKEFYERFRQSDGSYVRSVYKSFLVDKFGYSLNQVSQAVSEASNGILVQSRVSLFDSEFADCPAQLANENGTPIFRWANVTTTLKDIDTSQLHYVKVPENHVVIDFDLRGDDGEKDLVANLKAAAKWPSTYAELSKSGSGVHLHYNYTGDVSKLASSYSPGIEVKVFAGNASLRRKLTRCNDVPIATLSSGLPFKKGGKAVINFEGIKNEKALRTLIKRNLRKEIHPATKPSIDFISKILADAYVSGMVYDVTDLRPAVMAFATNSTNNSLYCVKQVSQMHFKSEAETGPVPEEVQTIVFYDVEVFPNLFVIVWKMDGEEHEPVRMINPGPTDIELLMKYRLVGFNNRRYDNHILYARLLGFDNGQLYSLSQRIVSGSHNAMFREAYNISYADIYDFGSKKQSLKKFEIDLGIHHQELGLPWDEPVPEHLWDKVAEYCANDVLATEAVFHARHNDFIAREILAKLSGLSINDTTRSHMTKIIFGNDRHPQDKFVYTDLSQEFPGYLFQNGVSTYLGEEIGEGGLVYAEPGYYENVALDDIESMHPHSACILHIFGEYTKRFEELLQARLAIKHGEYDKVSQMLDGALVPFLDDPDISLSDLSYALKIAINSVYGYTSAKFDCEFRDPRNVDNIVAKRGALFMATLKREIQARGYSVVHIKTDSVKIPNADSDILEFVQEFGAKYGYHFELEDTYKKLCLVNDAVYIAQKQDGTWTATGTQFAVPYVFKTLFSQEPLEFSDFCESKSVTGDSFLYLDFNENLAEGEHNYKFVGKAGAFCPVVSGSGGGILYRCKDGKYYAATGTKGYRWVESEELKRLGKEDTIDLSYYERLCDTAIKTISQFCDFETFVGKKGE